ncbi:PIG-L family deacetylase [Candidatus Woesearchaeota archaeon]|nr:PIG-L family deacetylase [Candidatus Woesearchaeota archaeon]
MQRQTTKKWIEKKSDIEDSVDKYVLIVCAHSDDQVFGPGGTIAKYSKEGIRVKTIIFSYGEMSHFWLKPRISIEMRVKEAVEADKMLGGDGVNFLGLTEGKFKEEFKQKNIGRAITSFIAEYKPIRILTHSPTDLHPDHKDVYELVNGITQKCHYDGKLYTFNVWDNMLNFGKTDYPKMYVDITNTFDKKLKALKIFKSQWMALLALTWSVYLKAFINGINCDKKYAEVFYLIK